MKHKLRESQLVQKCSCYKRGDKRHDKNQKKWREVDTIDNDLVRKTIYHL